MLWHRLLGLRRPTTAAFSDHLLKAPPLCQAPLYAPTRTHNPCGICCLSVVSVGRFMLTAIFSCAAMQITKPYTYKYMCKNNCIYVYLSRYVYMYICITGSSSCHCICCCDYYRLNGSTSDAHFINLNLIC